MIEILYGIFLLVMITQSITTLFFNLYAWSGPEREAQIAGPNRYIRPRKTFTILLPAYKEEAVMAQLINNINQLNYPKDKYEFIVLLQPKDKATIAVSRRALKKINNPNAHLVLVDPDHTPLNKPYQLNVGLSKAKFQYTVIFDSEDIVSPDILNIANTILCRHKSDILQCGVQLMDYSSRWFSSHNVLEYYFWFRSRMHALVKTGMVPLGGNTVFFKTDRLRQVDGWNENCLTEDAEIGLRLSVIGCKFRASYNPFHVTKEETPHTVKEFIKQRTRWCQGFIQIILLSKWRELPRLKQKILFFYLLGSPIIQTIMFIVGPIFITIGLLTDLSILLSMLSFIPIILIIALIVVQLFGLLEFVKEQKLKINKLTFLMFIPGFIPYQILLSIGAMRSVWRQIRKNSNWEKTTHKGLELVPLEKVT